MGSDLSVSIFSALRDSLVTLLSLGSAKSSSWLRTVHNTANASVQEVPLRNGSCCSDTTLTDSKSHSVTSLSKAEDVPRSSELGSAFCSFCDKFRFKFFQQLASITWIDFQSFVVCNNSRLTQTNPRSSFDVTTRVVVAIDIGNVLVSTSVSAQSRVSCCPRRKWYGLAARCLCLLKTWRCHSSDKAELSGIQ